MHPHRQSFYTKGTVCKGILVVYRYFINKAIASAMALLALYTKLPQVVVKMLIHAYAPLLRC